MYSKQIPHFPNLYLSYWHGLNLPIPVSLMLEIRWMFYTNKRAIFMLMAMWLLLRGIDEVWMGGGDGCFVVEKFRKVIWQDKYLR